MGILDTPRIVAAVIALLVLATAVFYVQSLRSALQSCRDDRVRLKAEIGQLKAEVAERNAAIEAQNRAIDQIRAAGEAAALASSRALAEARKGSERVRTEVVTLTKLIEAPTAPAAPCEAAVAVIRGELQ